MKTTLWIIAFSTALMPLRGKEPSASPSKVDVSPPATSFKPLGDWLSDPSDPAMISLRAIKMGSTGGHSASEHAALPSPVFRPADPASVPAATSQYWRSLGETVVAAKAAQEKLAARAVAKRKKFLGFVEMPEEAMSMHKELSSFAQQVRNLDTTNVDSVAISYAMEISRFLDEEAEQWRKSGNITEELLKMNSGARAWIRVLQDPRVLIDTMAGKVPPELKSDFETLKAEVDQTPKKRAQLATRRVELQAELVRKYDIAVPLTSWP